MRYLGLLVLAFFGMEIFSIVLVAGRIGAGMTVLLMILSAFAGMFLLRNAGVSRALILGEMLRGGGLSLYQLLWPLRMPLAGLLLVSPGFFSSICALLLLLPFRGKPLAQNKNTQSFGGFENFGGFSGSRKAQPDDGDIIEGDFVVREEGKQPRKAIGRDKN